MNSTCAVYIGLLEDGRFYTGVTQGRPESRLRRHQHGRGGTFTRGVRLVRILWSESHSTLTHARTREAQIKKWSHAKKQALIDGDIPRLKALARSRQSRATP